MLNGHSDLLETSILAKYSLAISTTVALFICLMCGVGQTLTSIWEHLDTKHTKLGMTALDKNHLKDIIEQGCPHCAYAAVKKTQVVNLGVMKKLFWVAVHTEWTVALSILQDIAQFHWKTAGNTGAIPNACLVSPWLMQTGWHTHVQPYDVSQLHKPVMMPDADLFVGLHDTILAYGNHATDLLDETDELVLQQINTADPEKM
ncbi:hypothetical protein L208DRAFT_1375265 [Tricholoma matsutake]|nr:hypothetical protein L208DRAFT_1375265 [Tricholoma matsutake 945]